MKILKKIILILIILLAAYICFFKLNSSSLENWDEAWYGDVIRNMMRTKNFIVLFHNRTVFLDKPPLLIWLGTIFSSILGLSELSVRLTSALAGFLTIILVCRFVNKKWGLIPTIISFGTLTLNNVFIWRTRSGNIDALVTLLIFLIFLVIVSKHKHKYFILGFLFAAVYLAKASLVVFPMLVFALSEFLYERRLILKRIPKYMLMMIIAILLCGVWLYLGDRQIGTRFSNYYLFQSDQNVVQISLKTFKTDYFLFAYYSLQRRFTYLLLFGLILLIAKIKEKQSFLILSFSLWLVLLLSFTERNNNWYLMPSMPFWSISIGYATYWLINFFKKYSIVIIGFLTVCGYIFFKTFTVNILPIINTISTKSQTEAAKYIKENTKFDEIIITMDEEYPTTIFYSDRKVYAFSANSGISNLFIGREDLKKLMDQKKLHWFVGSKDKAETFAKEFLNGYEYKTVFSNDDEVVYKVIY